MVNFLPWFAGERSKLVFSHFCEQIRAFSRDITLVLVSNLSIDSKSGDFVTKERTIAYTSIYLVAAYEKIAGINCDILWQLRLYVLHY